MIVAVGVGALAAVFYAGLVPLPGSDVEAPSVTVEDIGDWGEVSDDEVEIVHTLGVRNPNPVDVEIGSSTTADVQLELNEVRLGSVQKSGLDIEQGNNTVPVRSTLRQERLSEFWANFVNDDETIHARATVGLEVSAGPGFSVSGPPIEKSVLTDERPVSDAMNAAGDSMEGPHGRSVSTDDLADEYVPANLPEVGRPRTLRAEYTVEQVDFAWGEVTSERTEILMTVRVRNTGDTLLPGVPDGVAADVLLNDVEVFDARTESVSVRNLDGDSLLLPGEQRSYTLVATADNEQIEEWFTTYAANDERSSVRAELQLYFDLGDTSISVPEGGAVVYECRFQTGIFVDGQSTTTTCGESGTVTVGPSQIDESDLRDIVPGDTRDTTTTTRTDQDTTTATTTTRTERDTTAVTTSTVDRTATRTRRTTTERPTTVSSSPPEASIEASTTEGDAPLEVTFDASGSTDPDEDIARYVWYFGDGTPPVEGETVTHTFRTAGEYDVRLVVIDSRGNEDSDRVTIDVERIVG